MISRFNFTSKNVAQQENYFVLNCKCNKTYDDTTKADGVVAKNTAARLKKDIM